MIGIASRMKTWLIVSSSVLYHAATKTGVKADLARREAELAAKKEAHGELKSIIATSLPIFKTFHMVQVSMIMLETSGSLFWISLCICCIIATLIFVQN